MKIKPKRKCFLVCNAHLDPVWLWQWEDGLATALATFRVAARFCQRHPCFVFNHNESLLYEWVERHDPALFKIIQRLVKQKRWHIAGGAFLQPDLIAPSGESIIRQFLIGKRYFRSRFGVEPTTAYNFDPFGHPRGLIQILRGCGIDSYVFCRPGRQELPLPVGTFIWRHRSGAEILARRSDEHYLTNGQIRKHMKDHNYPAFYRSEGDFMYLWGIGNHGGGPSEQEYKDVLRLSEDWPDIDFIESTPEAFFKHTIAKRGRANLPIYTGDLQPTFEGCYTSMQRVKTMHRRAENIMRLTETLCAWAWWRGRHHYPARDLDLAWRDILFASFHDILPGSATPSVERDSLNLLGHGEEILRREKVSVQIALLRSEPRAKGRAVPIFVFNPHPWPVTQDVELEYTIDSQYASDAVVPELTANGRDVPLQREKPEHNFHVDWCLKIAFTAHVPACSYRRYDAAYRTLEAAQITPWRMPKWPAGRRPVFRADRLSVRLNRRTGLIDEVRWDGRRVLGPDSFQPLICDDLDHSYYTVPEWRAPRHKFRLASSREAAIVCGSEHVNPKLAIPVAPIRVIEDGPVRTVIEAVFIASGSHIIQQYIISKNHPVLRLRQTVFWAEHDKFLKLALRLVRPLTRVWAEKCYSIDEATAVGRQPGREHDFQRFLRLENAHGPAFGIVSHGTHGYSYRNRELRLSILRSPAYAVLEPNCRDQRYLHRYIPRQDQGVRSAEFTFVFGDLAVSNSALARAALEHDIPLAPFIFYPSGAGGQKATVASRPLVEVDKPNIAVGAIKRAETGKGLIVRLWETEGRNTPVGLTVDGVKHRLVIRPHGLKTVLIRRGKPLLETDLLERPLF